jgi:hypothetical protein
MTLDKSLIILLVVYLTSTVLYASEYFCPNGQHPNPNVIWCDSFEPEDIGPSSTFGANYFEFNNPDNSLSLTNTESIHGSFSLVNHWDEGVIGSGSFMRTFGLSPLISQSHPNEFYDEIYWRLYVKHQEGFEGMPMKLTRATVFADKNWSQAMIAHLWGNQSSGFLEIDPASGINELSQLATTKWNDFDNLSWLGARQAKQPITSGEWFCIETHVKLNTAGQADGILEFWINGDLQASRYDLNWRKNWTNYGINAVMFSNYWNGGSPRSQNRYLDAIVISTKRIGCIDEEIKPKSPDNIVVE